MPAHLLMVVLCLSECMGEVCICARMPVRACESRGRAYFLGAVYAHMHEFDLICLDMFYFAFYDQYQVGAVVPSPDPPSPLRTKSPIQHDMPEFLVQRTLRDPRIGWGGRF